MPSNTYTNNWTRKQFELDILKGGIRYKSQSGQVCIYAWLKTMLVGDK